MSEESDASEQKERNWGTATPEEFRAEMQRMQDELTEKVNAFICIVDAHARPPGYLSPPAANDSKPTDAPEASGG